MRIRSVSNSKFLCYLKRQMKTFLDMKLFHTENEILPIQPIQIPAVAFRKIQYSTITSLNILFSHYLY